MDPLDERYVLPDDAITVTKRQDRQMVSPYRRLWLDFAALDGRAILDGANEALAKGGDHPFTYCMEHVVPAMEKQGKGPDDPEAFCGWWKREHGGVTSKSKSKSARGLRVLRLTSAVGEVRTERYMGRLHYVVPVVALREGVMQASNAPTPELVPREALTVAPGGWNGRPVVGNHPNENGEQVSANEPERLERLSFGQLFHTRVEHGDTLALEAYLDPERAKAVGYDAQRVLERAQRGEPIEVSVGAIVVADPVAGVWRNADGSSRPYSAVWREIVPDHLAMLPEGVTGACSNDMGCGAPRMAANFDENQPRDEKGKWSGGGGGYREVTPEEKRRLRDQYGVNVDDPESVAAGLRVQNLVGKYLEGKEPPVDPVTRTHQVEAGRVIDRVFEKYGADGFAALMEIERQGLSGTLRDPSRPVPTVNVRKG